MPTTRASSRIWIPGIEEIASKMRPRTPVPPPAKPSLPEESGHVDQEKNRDLEARHHEQWQPSALEESEDQQADHDPFAECDSEGACEEQEGAVAVSPEGRGGEEHQGGGQDHEEARRH